MRRDQLCFATHFRLAVLWYPSLPLPKDTLKFPAKGVQVTAAVINGKIRMWDYVHNHSSTGRWNGAAAASMYSGPLVKALRKAFPRRAAKTKWHVLADNDPTGYKSKKGMKAKKSAGIRTDNLPKRSPDLNVLDSRWAAINTRMRIQERAFNSRKKENRAQFLARLRRTALALPGPVVQRAVCGMHRRVRLLVKAKGGLFLE